MNYFKTFMVLGIFAITGCTGNKNKEMITKEGVEIEVSQLQIGDVEVLPETIAPAASNETIQVIESIISLKNSGSSSFSLANMKISGDGHTIKLNRCGAEVLAGKSCKITVRFSGKGLYNGSYPGVLELNSQEIGTEILLPGTVSGKPNPDLEGAANLQVTMNAPFNPIGEEGHRIITVKNIGAGSAKNVVVVVPADYALRLNRCPSVLAPQKSCAIQVSLKNFRNLSTAPAEEVSLNITGAEVKVNLATGQVGSGGGDPDPGPLKFKTNPLLSEIEKNTDTLISGQVNSVHFAPGYSITPKYLSAEYPDFYFDLVCGQEDASYSFYVANEGLDTLSFVSPIAYVNCNGGVSDIPTLSTNEMLLSGIYRKVYNEDTYIAVVESIFSTSETGIKVFHVGSVKMFNSPMKMKDQSESEPASWFRLTDDGNGNFISEYAELSPVDSYVPTGYVGGAFDQDFLKLFYYNDMSMSEQTWMGCDARFLERGGSISCEFRTDELSPIQSLPYFRLTVSQSTLPCDEYMIPVEVSLYNQFSSFAEDDPAIGPVERFKVFVSTPECGF